METEHEHWADPYFAALGDGVLQYQTCTRCGVSQFPPRPHCTGCFSVVLDWTRAAGMGEVYSFTIVLENAPSGFTDRGPYVVAIIRLDEGLQMMSNVIGCAPEDVRCGMRVRARFERVGDMTLPMFEPAGGAA